jgi:hypothetical protein
LEKNQRYRRGKSKHRNGFREETKEEEANA